MFTPIETSIGALFLHQATSILLHYNGGILGASEYMRRLFSKPTTSTAAFFAGMAASFSLLKHVLPELVTTYPPIPSTPQQVLVTVGIGMLVGWGSKAAHGCTSGHMLCGLSRLNARSALAVAIFFPMALLTHHVVNPTLTTEVCTGELPCYTPIYPPRAITTSLVMFAVVTIATARIVPQLVMKISQTMNTDVKTDVAAPARDTAEFFAGLEFGLGLLITQMSNPAKVASFLSFPNLELWDPSMILVILFGIVPSIIENQSKGFDTPPRFRDKFDLPRKTLANTDWKFVSGAAVFGIGWGLSGTCPGPAVLRSFLQPAWGSLFMGGFLLGAMFVSEDPKDAGMCG